MKNKLTPELLEKAKQAKSAEELGTLAKENGIELTAEEANTYFTKLNPEDGELSDDELDEVAGGGCGDEQNRYDGWLVIDSPSTYTCGGYTDNSYGYGRGDGHCTTCSHRGSVNGMCICTYC